MQAHALKSEAELLGPEQRIEISLSASAGSETISELARKNNVSRKFVYKQKEIAGNALSEAFSESVEEDKVIFTLPVTKKWIRQLVLGLVLICHSSFRGVEELLGDVFDYHNISIGTVHNIVAEAVIAAGQINNAADLSRIRVGAHDEIYQAGKPVLVGADVESTFCYLLSVEQSCDETSWGVNLLDLLDRGLKPDYTVADGGKALRAGQKAAWNGVPCHGDVFHAEMYMGRLAFYLERRAAGCVTAREKLQNKMEKAKKRKKGNTISVKLAKAREAEAKAVSLARDVRILSDWMKQDILSSGGAAPEVRKEMFDFIVDELKKLEALCFHRIKPVRRMLENNRDNLLAFTDVLDEKFEEISDRCETPKYLLWKICELQGISMEDSARWQKRAQLQKKLGRKYHEIEKEVIEAMSQVHRASSIIENINSRLRNYFFLRRHIGNDYLELLRFFLNHRKFIRSQRPERVGKSPAELLYGSPHPHWLELLGYERFKRT